MIIVEKNVQAELKSGEREIILKLDVKFMLTNILTFILPSICVTVKYQTCKNVIFLAIFAFSPSM